MALLLVLWLVALFAALVGGFARTAQMERLQGSVLRDSVVAGEAARAVRALEQVVADHPGTKAAARAAAVAARQRKRAP